MKANDRTLKPNHLVCCDVCSMFYLTFYAITQTRIQRLIVVVSKQSHISFLTPNSVSLCAGGGGNLSVMASQRGSSPCPPLPHYTDSNLISHKGNLPPHEFGYCSPMGPGQASFHNSANGPEIFFSVINLINILIMTWG